MAEPAVVLSPSRSTFRSLPCSSSTFSALWTHISGRWAPLLNSLKCKMRAKIYWRMPTARWWRCWCCTAGAVSPPLLPFPLSASSATSKNLVINMAGISRVYRLKSQERKEWIKSLFSLFSFFTLLCFFFLLKNGLDYKFLIELALSFFFCSLFSLLLSLFAFRFPFLCSLFFLHFLLSCPSPLFTSFLNDKTRKD